MIDAQPGQEQRMEKLAICKSCAQTFDRSKPHDCPGLTTRPTADLGEDGELIAALRKRAAWQRENRGDMLDYGTPDPELEQAADRLILYREARDRDESLLRQVFEAIESGRSEPLFIMRDAIRNHLDDRADDRGGTDAPRDS